MLYIVVIAIGLSLIAGAAAALFLPLPERLKGNAMAFGGGALLSSLVLELYVPALEAAGAWAASATLVGGAVAFALVDHWVDEVWGSRSGFSLLAAISLDGIPENLALGVKLVGSGALSSFAVSIFLSNLPEAAAGAHNMRERGWSRRRILLIWTVAAIVLGLVTVGGRAFLSGTPDSRLSLFSAFAAGAVVASLVTELFPQAYRDDDDLIGVASALGVVCAAVLSQ